MDNLEKFIEHTWSVKKVNNTHQEYFRIPTDPSMNELVDWFQTEFVSLSNSMKNSNHSYNDKPNPFHLEDSVWTHTMMVCMQAEMLNVSKINKICALLHDIGKPICRTVIDGNSKKPIYNEADLQKNKDLENEIPQNEKKVHFRGHEGVSSYLSIELLNDLLSRGVIDSDELIMCFRIISLHGILFDYIDEDGNEKKPHKIFEKFKANEYKLFEYFITQVKCDSLGRFYKAKNGRKNSAMKLGTEIYTTNSFIEYHKNKNSSLSEKVVKKLEKRGKIPKSNSILLYVGLPCSGKSTYSKYFNGEIISRDDILIEYGKEKYNNGEFSKIFNMLTDEDQEKIDIEYRKRFVDATKTEKDILIDMTNLTKKSRRSKLNRVDESFKKQIKMFIVPLHTLYERNKKRFAEEGKFIRDEVYLNMAKKFIVPTYDEADEIEFIV